MDTLQIQGIKFTSYIKLLLIISISTGTLLGLVMFIMSLFGGPVTAELGTKVFSGVTAGILGIFMMPIMFLFFGIVIGLVSYIPFKVALKLMNGLTINLK
ncbi:hypothetical protein [Piscibacillus halophilus]|mgnify:CR=1 FL=1|uniref:DUF3566 domain-containing protein n=1 Tax=Piscibacillus halophilus TaxID=571933 RepID=A0A1H9DFX3_9BACI|nr:hypothetical protein [Piscibacillus halophilus]SEQ12390.1 hypothetical protein SAMN05216362_1077 [Piscibacillus halophilus]